MQYSVYCSLSNHKVDFISSWRWMDGTTLGIQKWDENEPDTSDVGANCVIMTYFMGEWCDNVHAVTTVKTKSAHSLWLLTCTSTDFTGLWTSTNCGQEYKSICKRPGSTPANSTVAPTVPPKGGCPLTWTKFGTKVRYDWEIWHCERKVSHTAIFLLCFSMAAKYLTLIFWKE